MIGNNTMNVNEATVIAAMEEYLNKRLIPEAHLTVKSVRKADRETFAVEVSPKDATAARKSSDAKYVEASLAESR